MLKQQLDITIKVSKTKKVFYWLDKPDVYFKLTNYERYIRGKKHPVEIIRNRKT